MNFPLGALDTSIIVLYLIAVLSIGFWFGKKNVGPEDYFLAGRSLTWPVIGLSLFAANMSSSSLVGLAGSGYKTGFSVFSYEWMATLVLILFAVFFLPFYLRSRVFTMPEFLEKRYDFRVRYYFSSLTVLLNIFVDAAATLFSGSLVVQMIFPSLPLWAIIGLTSLLAGIYVIAGGLSAVVYTDAVQATILLFGSVTISLLAWQKAGGWEAVEAVTSPEHFRVIQSSDDPFLPWPGLVTGVFLLGFYFWATNQFIVQRALASRDTRNGQWGALFTGLLKLSVLFILIMPGAFARVLYPDIQNPNLVYPTLLFDLLPVGLKGLVVSVLMAGMMSSVNSALNAASTLITMDFYRKFRQQATEAQLMHTGKIVTCLLMVVAAVWAPQIASFPTLWDYLQQVLALACPPVVALFMVGLFWRGANSRGAQAAIVTGLVLAALSALNTGTDWMPHYLYVSGINFACCCAALWLGSKTGHATAGSDQLVWTPAFYHEETVQLRSLPWFHNYRYQSLALIALVAVLLMLF